VIGHQSAIAGLQEQRPLNALSVSLPFGSAQGSLARERQPPQHAQKARRAGDPDKSGVIPMITMAEKAGY
jgi:hypothetical protein